MDELKDRFSCQEYPTDINEIKELMDVLVSIKRLKESDRNDYL